MVVLAKLIASVNSAHLLVVGEDRGRCSHFSGGGITLDVSHSPLLVWLNVRGHDHDDIVV